MDVLLVEDEPLVREAVAEVLAEAGLAVAAAGSAEGALAAEPPPAVLVTDVNLGPASSMDGIALAEALRRRWPGLGVVVVTGREENLPRCACLAPRERHLTKPFAPDDLLAAVRDLGAEPPG